MKSSVVSIIMGSDSDLPIMKEASIFLESIDIPVEIKVLSAHRTPEKVLQYVQNAVKRGIKVIIAGAGGAAHLPGVIASIFPMPVIGVPIKSSNSTAGLDSILSILQMPSGVPVATVALDGARNAGILAAQILSTGNNKILESIINFKKELALSVETKNSLLEKIGYTEYLNRKKK